MPERQAEVHVARAEDGTVRIAGAPARPQEPAFTRAVLDVAGATLTWPVLGSPGLPTAEIHDVERAQQWLWALYGERTAATVHTHTHTYSDAHTAGRPTDAAPLTEQVTALAAGAARLALGHWAARWWPASYLDGIPALEQDVLGLELAALTHECQQLFDDAGDQGDQPDDNAAELIADHQAALAPLIRWWRDARQPTHPAHPTHPTHPVLPVVLQLDHVLRLIDDAADNAGLDGEPLRLLRSSLEQDSGPPAGAPLDLGTLFAGRRGYALAAGEPLATGGRVIARGSGTNDWRRYPPRFVDAAENAVSWTASAVGAGRRIEVEVVADVAAPVGGVHLAAEVTVNGGPPTRVRLAGRDDAWTGRADLDIPAAALPPRIEVGVLLPGFDPGPDPDTSSRATRDAVRALARHRLTTAAMPTPQDSQDSYAQPFLAEIAAAATAAGEDF
ncbi:hypothetical protein [Streptomyces adelaidensis]|uniref:hypothetical protein n=1 Tax=Streptomyces adelaidensis TaxID=2796465 RepID=UPI001904D602|nr:hypothetical protein [Streptomyces adelaidensis]